MDDLNRINIFLGLMAGLAKYGYRIDKEVVRLHLMNFGVKDGGTDISYNFKLWMERFKNNPNINVFVDPDWDYFCQFVSSEYDRSLDDGLNEIKLYIPVDKEHIFEAANHLFDFLSSEKILHLSKIGKHVRFDNIVVRVTNSTDANKIIDFVNHNSYLNEGALQLSPFVPHDGNVSVVWDGNLSYNSVVSSWISEYINWEKDNNNLDRVSYQRFYYYVLERFNSLFQQGVGLKEHFKKISDEETFLAISSYDDSFKLLNYYNVTRLLLCSLNSNVDKEFIYDYVDKISNSNIYVQDLNRINQLYRGNVISYEEKYLKHQKDALKQAFICMCQKYGYSKTRNSFLKFMNDGNFDNITRYNNARQLLIGSGISKEIFSKIAYEWFKRNIDIEKTMANAFYDTYDKFDYYQVVSAVKKLFMEKDFSQITNRNGERLQLINKINSDEISLHIMEILTRNGYKIEYSSVENLCGLYISLFNKNISRKTASL